MLHLLPKTYMLGDHLYEEVHVGVNKKRRIGWKSIWEAIRLEDFLFHDAEPGICVIFTPTEYQRF